MSTDLLLVVGCDATGPGARTLAVDSEPPKREQAEPNARVHPHRRQGTGTTPLASERPGDRGVDSDSGSELSVPRTPSYSIRP